MSGDEVHRQPFLGNTYSKGAAAHALYGRRVARLVEIVYVQCRTFREINCVLLLVNRVLREECDLDVPTVGEGRERAVRIAPAEGLLEVLERFLAVLATDLLQRHDVRVQPPDHVSEQLELVLVALFGQLFRPKSDAEEVLYVPGHRLESSHLIFLRV